MTHGVPLTALIIIFFWKGPNWCTFFKSGDAIDTFFLRVPNWHTPTKMGTIHIIKPKINLQIVEFHFVRGLFGMEDAKECRKVLNPSEWWEMFGDGTPRVEEICY